MGMKPPRPAAIAAALIFALSCFGFTLFVWVSFGGSVPLQAKGYRFHAHFGSDAINLTRGSQVRISGVKVGKVVDVKEEQGGLDATLQLESRYAPISSDSRAVIRIKTLLGETFIELTPGNPQAPRLKENASLPKNAVMPSQTLDQVLSAFDKRTRDDLKRFLNELSTALDKRGEDINAALGNAAPTFDDLSQIVDVLDRQKASVRRLVRNAGVAFGAVGRRSGDVQRLITAGDQVFSATAARNRELTATVKALPSFLRELRGTLTALDTTATVAGPTVHALRPVAPLFKPAVRESAALLPQVVPLASELGPVFRASRKGLPAANRIVDASRPVIDVFNPTGSGIAGILTLLLPVTDFLDIYKKDVVQAFVNVNAATQYGAKQPDGKFYRYLRTVLPINNENVYGQATRLASNRHNPYVSPDGLLSFATGPPEAYDCRNTSNPQTLPIIGTGGAPPCVTQKPFAFRGNTLSYPHLTHQP